MEEEDHRGNRLARFLHTHKITGVRLAHAMSVHRNTVANWVADAGLPDSKLIAIAHKFPALPDYFPEVNFEEAMAHEPPARYTAELSAECQRQIEEWRSKYIALSERYNTLLEKHLALVES